MSSLVVLQIHFMCFCNIHYDTTCCLPEWSLQEVKEVSLHELLHSASLLPTPSFFVMPNVPFLLYATCHFCFVLLFFIISPELLHFSLFILLFHFSILILFLHFCIISESMYSMAEHGLQNYQRNNCKTLDSCIKHLKHPYPQF